jgi:ubiquinone/menaquinone biosynthesis C-methylase UbiE
MRSLLIVPGPDDDAAERGRIGRVYGEYADSQLKRRNWSAENPGNVAIRAELVNAVFDLAARELLSAQKILDIGCGSGWWLERLAGEHRISARLHGLELLPERAAAARTRVPAAAIATGDARALPYEDQSFDVVTLFTVLSSLSAREDVQTALHEARRVLAPGGALLLWEPRVRNPLNPNTILVSHGLLKRGLGGMRTSIRTTTVLPPLARRLGRRTEQLYPLLARIPPLCTHRLVCAWAEMPGSRCGQADPNDDL